MNQVSFGAQLDERVVADAGRDLGILLQNFANALKGPSGESV